jgi:hypothetical protein
MNKVIANIGSSVTHYSRAFLRYLAGILSACFVDLADLLITAHVNQHAARNGPSDRMDISPCRVMLSTEC